MLLGSGCRSRAYQDVYQQELLSEIRVLEDQLYEADYQNEKLAEKLHRAKQRAARCETSGEADGSPEALREAPAPTSDAEQQERRGDPDLDEPDSYELDDDLMIDPGEAYDPDRPVEPEDSEGDLLPAPGGPQPPGEQDLRIPPIEEGEPVPPPQPGESDDGPPGKIELDNALGVLGGADESLVVPAAQTLRLHPGFSGGHHLDSDDQIDGLLLVVSVIDDTGSEVDLSQFEITADMTIVALDPLREPSDARLARWELTAGELQELVGSRPVHGLHIPVSWQDKQPLGDQVAVHLRLQSEEDQLQCEATLPLETPTAVAEWTPRGEGN